MNEPNIPSRTVQRFGGLFIVIVSLGFIMWTWHTAFSEGYFYPKAAMIFPPFLFLGLGIILFPDYKTERISRGEDISQLSGLKLLTPRWWAILVIGLLAGFANFIVIRYFGGQ